VDVSLDVEERDIWVAKIGSDSFEVNVKFGSLEELLQLSSIREAGWNNRSSIKAGRSADTDVYWCVDGDSSTLLIGHDDELWDVAINLPTAVIDDLVAQDNEASQSH
jgi:hypothetical protein